ncbi:hypothetical protein NKH57_25575 [Mesorhizobium sp. M1050]|uniref:hypothetical protein n=1 Tax=Mesorhizobium sp. M1050 TaxID=2957051 RepID=UPI00333D422E
MQISHEAIYRAPSSKAEGPCPGTRGPALQSFVSSEIMISQRPAKADDRVIPEHWEATSFWAGSRHTRPADDAFTTCCICRDWTAMATRRDLIGQERTELQDPLNLLRFTCARILLSAESTDSRALSIISWAKLSMVRLLFSGSW